MNTTERSNLEKNQMTTGNISTLNNKLNRLVSDGYNNKKEIDHTINNYYTKNEIDTKLMPYEKTSDVNEKLKPYEKTNDVNEKLKIYEKTATVDEKLKLYETLEHAAEIYALKTSIPHPASRKIFNADTFILSSGRPATSVGLIQIFRSASDPLYYGIYQGIHHRVDRLSDFPGIYMKFSNALIKGPENYIRIKFTLNINIFWDTQNITKDNIKDCIDNLSLLAIPNPDAINYEHFCIHKRIHYSDESHTNLVITGEYFGNVIFRNNIVEMYFIFVTYFPTGEPLENQTSMKLGTNGILDGNTALLELTDFAP